MFSHVIRANGYAICTLLGEPCSIIPATLYFSHHIMQLPHETAATLGGTTAANKVVSARTSVCDGTSISRSDWLADSSKTRSCLYLLVVGVEHYTIWAWRATGVHTSTLQDGELLVWTWDWEVEA